jgi:cytidine deaminase
MVQLAKWAQVEQAVQEYQLRAQLVIFIYNGQAGFHVPRPFLTVTYMRKETTGFTYEVYDDISQLDERDALLLEKAKAATASAYAPYSGFCVGASALMDNREIITGTNQENASYPAGLCAERVLLSTASSIFPGMPVISIAISYSGNAVKSDHPVSPCGICRQALTEMEERQKRPLRLVLAGMEGPVFIISSAQSLLPLAFKGDELP